MATRSRRAPGFWAFQAAAACLTAGIVQDAPAQLVAGDDVTQQIMLIDLSGATPPRVLAGANVASIAADEANQMLYWVDSSDNLWKAPYATSGGLTSVLVGPTAENTFGLAYDSVAQQLVGAALSQDNAGVITTRLVSIDTSTGAATTIVTLPDWFRVAGLDFDAATNALYATNMTNLTSPEARYPQGVYTLAKPFATTTPILVAGFQDNAYSGAKGAAVGNGRLFVIGGTAPPFQATPTNPHNAFNLATGVYEPLPALPSQFSSGAAWAPGLIAPPAGTNLVVTVGASDTCTVAAGGTLKFSVRIDNYGAADSGPVTVTVTLPASGATFASSTPAPTSSTATELTYLLPSIPGYGSTAYANVGLQFNAVTPGATVSITATAAVVSDTDLSNNTAAASTSIQPATAATAPIKGVLSTIATHPTSLLPGSTTERITWFKEPVASPDGNWWSVRVNTSAGRLPGQPDRILINDAVIRSATVGAPHTLIHAVTTTTSRGKLTLRTASAIDNNGDVAIAGGDYTTLFTPPSATFLLDRPADTLSLVAKTSDGVNFIEVARQGTAIPGLPGETFTGFLFGATGLFNDGTVGFWTELRSPTLLPGKCFLSDSGNTLIARQNVTMPGGSSDVLGDLGAHGTLGSGPSFDATGAHHSYYGNLANATNDAVVVVDGQIALQSGVTTLPGAGRMYEGNGDLTRMAPDGTWMVLDLSSVGPDVVIRGSGPEIGQVVKTGDPIFAGATETWSDVLNTGIGYDPANTFFTHQPGPNGHYIIGGFTDSEDLYTDSVLVYDSAVVIARENDPVDLDSNGVFDDDTYIRSFVYTDAINGSPLGALAYTSDHAVLIAVSLRSGASALCHVNDRQYPWALVRIPLPITGACCTGSSCTMVLGAANCAGSYKGDDSACSLPGQPSTCCPADFNGSGGVSVQDIFDFLAAYFSGNPTADFNDSGMVSVQDIFDYLAAYFAGC